ncbi:hypothetical protein NL676_035041 [Syzygium grande]|nr:hypothetical protein NL676_035041 [Syzygium grande]
MNKGNAITMVSRGTKKRNCKKYLTSLTVKPKDQPCEGLLSVEERRGVSRASNHDRIDLLTPIGPASIQPTRGKNSPPPSTASSRINREEPAMAGLHVRLRTDA